MKLVCYSDGIPGGKGLLGWLALTLFWYSCACLWCAGLCLQLNELVEDIYFRTVVSRTTWISR